jgi:hypothetical protein
MFDKILAVIEAFEFGWEAGSLANDLLVQDAIDEAFDNPGSGEMGAAYVDFINTHGDRTRRSIATTKARPRVRPTGGTGRASDARGLCPRSAIRGPRSGCV